MGSTGKGTYTGASKGTWTKPWSAPSGENAWGASPWSGASKGSNGGKSSVSTKWAYSDKKGTPYLDNENGGWIEPNSNSKGGSSSKGSYAGSTKSSWTKTKWTPRGDPDYFRK